MNYSYFDSIKSKKCRPVTVEQLFERVKEKDIQDTCSAILDALKKGDEALASRLKSKLPVIVLGQLYKPRHFTKQEWGHTYRSAYDRLRRLPYCGGCKSAHVRCEAEVAQRQQLAEHHRGGTLLSTNARHPYLVPLD